ncbi:hypothetical protein IJF93_00810 [Candidatus Saccharibacteria bacterium]|nr:hypothetical protein [Candidatus Saccharibacteria bacterium]
MAQKRKRKNGSKKWAYWILMVMLFVGAGVVCYFVWDVYFKVKDDSGNKDAEVSQEETKDEMKDEEKSEGEIETAPEKEKVVQYEGEDPNTAEVLSGVMTYAGVSGDSLMIRVNIDQYLSGGSCGLSLLKDGVEEYSDVSAIVDSAATSTCEGFDVPVSELDSGLYQIVINLDADGKTGAIKGEAKV